MSKCEWRSDRDEGYRCRVAVEEGSKFCIFHEPGERDIEKFRTKFYEQVDEEGPQDQRNARYDFQGYVFPHLDIVSSGTPRTSALGLVLPQKVNGDLMFSETTIEGGVVFSNSEIQGEADFTGARIDSSVIFSNAKIKGRVLFSSAEVEVDTSFERATIGGNANFDGVKIGSDAHFSNATA